ncbi:Fungal specific transcription factor domain-containing protein [Colletotrichum higginsianum IMI 349063]|uniref:Fungal specific transcription factor domain-containing protein n=1 Tax=Colletotrichum higginsianum (strain IMI 349063) TaxID=759273 RepID=A0A1B7YH75_COLHI|nr:Fungal specific transcription factor domain-containing protein [Colletotrichum higginsianum IMI 349063]OBR11244.1 Fungal specific transcription factor domain-containing protein [Colletotrichum higginsianum IMI 349063]
MDFYCLRRQRPSTCRYSPQQRRRAPAPTPRTPSPSVHNGTHHQSESEARHSRSTNDPLAEEETEVPREARLLCDAQGKLIFIGDCAPLSFFQTVRQLVNTRVDPHVFAHQSENPPFRPPTQYSGNGEPSLHLATIPRAISTYHAVVRYNSNFLIDRATLITIRAGLVDLFGHAHLVDEVASWAQQTHRLQDASSATFYLVLAIGYQSSEEDVASAYFEYARNIALTNLSGNINVPTIQTFILVTLYMLGSCQMNGAFLFFGIAVRAAYSIGIHRTEINSRFGHEIHRQRDRLWKSLRVLDLFLSTSMGRPPATSDVDCTVPYRASDDSGQETFDLLNASAQIFLITEGIVVEVYSRRKVSYQLTEGISRQLRDWSLRWLQRLKDVVAVSSAEDDPSKTTGACQGQTSFEVDFAAAVILVSRPFLMYELHKRLTESSVGISVSKSGLVSGKSKLADACIDAASFMVDILVGLTEKGYLNGHMPLIVSWLFASSLILGVGLLGSFGRILEKYARNAIMVLEHFAKSDAHAAQYSMIAKTLLNAALDYLEKKELQERIQRTESSSQLFGLVPRDSADVDHTPRPSSNTQTTPAGADRTLATKPTNSVSGFLGLGFGSPPFADADASFLGLSASLPQTPDLSVLDGRHDDHGFGDLNLFQLLDGDGHIDLGPYI